MDNIRCDLNYVKKSRICFLFTNASDFGVSIGCENGFWSASERDDSRRQRRGNSPVTFIATEMGSAFSARYMSDEGFMPGATTVGVVCKDGAILASERRYSYGTFVMSKVAKKVFKITDNIGVGCAGIIGDMQVLAREANAYMSIYRYERGRPGTVKNTAKLFASILSSRRLYPYLAQTIIAGIDDGVPELFVLDPIGSVLGDKFAAVGTGAEIAMGVLESEYRDGLSVEEARPLVLRAIKSAVARDISSGDGVDLLIITHSGVKEESQKFA